MSDWMDLILVETNGHDEALYEAPGFSYLEAGDFVITDTYDGIEFMGEVKAAITISRNSDAKNFILACMHQREPLGRIRTKLKKSPMFFDDEPEVQE